MTVTEGLFLRRLPEDGRLAGGCELADASPTVGVGGYKSAAGGFYLLIEEGELVHTEGVFVQAEDEEVAIFRVHLAAGEEENAVSTSEAGQVVGVPEGIVLRDADAVQSKALGLQGEFIRRLNGVVGVGGGVGVQVYEHGGIIAQGWGRY